MVKGSDMIQALWVLSDYMKQKLKPLILTSFVPVQLTFSKKNSKNEFSNLPLNHTAILSVIVMYWY